MSNTDQTNEVEYQTYQSTMKSHKMVTTAGKVLHFIDNKFVTNNEDDIAYLDAEIKAGFPYVRKGEVVTSSDLDPMAALRKKMYAEFLAEQEAGGGSPEASTSDAAKVVPVSSDAVAAKPTSDLIARLAAAKAKEAEEAK